MKRIFNLLAWLLILPATSLSAAKDVQVTGIRYWTAPGHTRIVLDLQGQYTYRVSTRTKPERVVIDVAGGNFSCATDVRKVGDKLIDRVRCNELNSGAQVVIDLSGEYKYRYFALDPIPGRKPQRIVIDIFPEQRGAPDSSSPPVEETIPESKPDPPIAVKPRVRTAPIPSDFKREIVIAIDAGHGGEDPGAVYRGLYEKRITMDIARRLKRKIDAIPGFRCVLIRDGDYFIELSQRRKLANETDADMLISIHSNTAPNRSARGVEVYYLSTKGATSRAAQAVADLENRSDLVGGVHPAANEEQVKLVLGEKLSRSIERSRLLANIVWQEAKRDKGLRSQRQVKRANFAVCKMLSMPSILVEVGFMTNNNDRKLLNSDSGLDTLAKWLSRSVETYFKKFPATLFDPLFSENEKLMYKVRRGDSLSRIAKRFGVSVDDLMSVNNIKRPDRLSVGQKLLVVAGIAQPVIHKVRRGESLTRIASRYGVTVESLLEANRLNRNSILHPGQKLVIQPDSQAGSVQ
ncbi:MAG: LysM peptidoglycan-binding domain-containing protein [bacterium]|nr:LysM peptidoglycan-binding domain-containing protein [bacterium]